METAFSETQILGFWSWKEQCIIIFVKIWNKTQHSSNIDDIKIYSRFKICREIEFREEKYCE